MAAATVVGLLGVGQGAWAHASAPAGGVAGAGTLRAVPIGSAAAGAGAYTVTLVTGDRVTLQAADATTATVQAGPGRERVSFTTYALGGHLYVLPSDARRLVQAQKVDRRLFDVTELVRSGYHDAARTTVPLIVRGRGGASAQSADGTVSRAGARVTRRLPAIRASAVTADKSKTGALWNALTGNRDTAAADTAAGVGRIWLDGTRRPTLAASVPQIGAPAAWQAGFTGKGVTVAVLDTGIDATHPDLAGKVAQAKVFVDTPGGDQLGHGTHVASTIAGSGAASGGRNKGVAPEARLLDGKVCESEECPDSAILAAMHWAAVDQKAAVVNVSLGSTDTPETDPLEEAVNTLTAQTGALFVVAAGNGGLDGAATVTSPGSADAALTVGAVDSADALADFSSRGPRVGDNAVKPDITAPGVNITAALATGTGEGDERYVAFDGTSMAAPHVAGAAALLAQQQPGWKAPQLKATLMGSAKPHATLGAFEQGAGRVDLTRAITQTVTADPPSLSYGLTAWPHTDDKPIVKKLTYRNTAATSTTLNLTLPATAADGGPAPAGMFTLSATTLTVPAGGTASVDVTANTGVAGPDGFYSARVVATAGPTVVVTPVGVDKEGERYNVTVRHLDATGAATGQFQSYLNSLTSDFGVDLGAATGTVTIRIPKGRYGLCSVIEGADQDGGSAGGATAMLAAPLLTVTGDTTVTVDARSAKPVVMTVPEPAARAMRVTVDLKRPAREHPEACQVSRPDPAGLTVGQVGTSLPGNQFVTTVSSHWTRPGAEGTPAPDSPYAYHVAEVVRGRVPNGLVRHYAKGDLAEVRQTFPPGAGETWDRSVSPVVAGNLSAGDWTRSLGSTPTLVEYYSTGAGLRWSGDVRLGQAEPDSEFPPRTIFVQDAVAYQPGRRYADEWGKGPFGPALGRNPTLSPWDGARSGDRIWASAYPNGDANGHRGYISAIGEEAVAYTVELHRNGTPVEVGTLGPSFWATLPAEAADYRLHTSAKGQGHNGLATQVDTVTTFRSAHTDEPKLTPLPLFAVRYTPRLDAQDAAPAGAAFDVPVTVQRLPGVTATAVRSLGIDVSYDDGATWRPATVTRRGPTSWTARVTHPATAGFVSLRARAADSAGNTVEQTVVRSYRVAAG